MKTNTALLFIVVLICSAFKSDQAYNKIFFTSLDGVKVTADFYLTDKNNDFIILCHQANYSRGEYRETAVTLMDMGYNCLAVDLRSGGTVNDVSNETFGNAQSKGKKTSFLDAKQDIEAAINFLVNEYSAKPILLGSSYSASLALMIANENDNIKAVVAYSPGEYFKKEKVSIYESIKGIDKPTYITGRIDELNQLEPILDVVTNDNKVMFLPSEEGAHGSKALWYNHAAAGQYWSSLTDFLKSL